MNLLDIFNYEYGLFIIIINELNDTDLNSLLCCKKWDKEKYNFILSKIIQNIKINFKDKNIILPWKYDYPDTIQNIINLVKSYKNNIIIKRTKGWSLAYFEKDKNDQNYSTINYIKGAFYHVNDPQYFNVTSFVNVEKSKNNITANCILGIQVIEPDISISYWDEKNYLLIPPNIHKELCKTLTRQPISL